MLRRLFLGALLLLLGSFSARLQAQVDSRPRRTQVAPAPSETNSSQVDADAEAKRLYKVGVKYGHAGLYKEAAEAFEQAVKLKPDYGDAYLGLGHAYYDLRQWGLAIDRIKRGLAFKPGDKSSRDRLAHAQKMLEQESAGRDAYKAIGSSSSLTARESAKAREKNISSDQDLTKFYRVGAGDVLDVRLTADPSSESTFFTISAAGFLDHPQLSAPVASAGLTVQEIATAIEDDLRKHPSIKNPKVSVGVEEYISHTILVSGLVKEPGTKSLKREGIPLYVVIADAQPLPEAGQVTVQRNASNENFVIDLSDTPALSLLVRPGDVITLSEKQAQFFYVSGLVVSPGEKAFRRGLTLTQAIIAAGGLTNKAKEAHLARDNGKGFLTVSRYALKDINSGKVADPAIQAGDRITIKD